MKKERYVISYHENCDFTDNIGTQRFKAETDDLKLAIKIVKTIAKHVNLDSYLFSLLEQRIKKNLEGRGSYFFGDTNKKYNCRIEKIKISETLHRIKKGEV